MLRDTSGLDKILLSLRTFAIVVAITGAVGLGWAYGFETPNDAVGTDGQGGSFDMSGFISVCGFPTGFPAPSRSNAQPD